MWQQIHTKKSHCSNLCKSTMLQNLICVGIMKKPGSRCVCISIPFSYHNQRLCAKSAFMYITLVIRLDLHWWFSSYLSHIYCKYLQMPNHGDEIDSKIQSAKYNVLTSDRVYCSFQNPKTS